MGRNTTHHTGRALAGLAAVSVLGLTACAGGDDDDAAATAATEAPASEATIAAEAVTADEGAGGGDAQFGVAPGAPGGGTVGAQVGQQLTIEARATMQTADVRDAVERITDVVAARGGRVASADIDYASPAAGAEDEPATSRATLVVAIPPAGLGDVRSVLDEVGDLLSYDQLAEDVTEQLADLDTRIANQRASIERIRELYAAAVDIDAIVRIEAELTSRETVLEQMLAAQQSLTDRVALSTLTIDIATAPEALAAAEDDDPGLGDALAGGWSAFAGGAFAIVLALTAAMPFVLSGLVVAVLAMVVRSRVRSRSLSPQRRQSEPLREDDAVPASRPG